MTRAWNLTRSAAVYRHASFSAGLKAAGYDVRSGNPEGRPGDVLLIWNRYGGYDELATRFERAGGRVIVAENGYLNVGGGSPHGQKVRTVYALGLGAHNDERAVPEGGPERWNALGIDLKPWRVSGSHVLVCPNRSFGTPGRIMPLTWGVDTVKRLQKLTKREIRLRAHPGNEPPKKPLADDLAGAWACVIWQSSAGVHSLVHGVPVICCSPAWICKSAAGSDLREIENPPMPWRRTAFERLACGQWHISEIEDGTAFDYLLRTAGQGQIAACA